MSGVTPVVGFLAAACALAPYAGIQYDEALFASPLYAEVAREMKMRAFHHDVPLMLMSYLGAAKTWLFGLIFWLWSPNVWSLRLPAILIGAATVAGVYALVRRTAGNRVALAAAMLLATDASYILTTTFDWGPVAIQHLGWTLGVLLTVDGQRRESPWRIGAGFLMFGLAMWDKAIFIWMLSGTGMAALAVFHRKIRRALRVRNVAAAVVGFGVGAAPLIVYNVRNPMQTFQGNAVFSTEDAAQKVATARRTLSGGALFGYIVNDETREAARAPRTALEAAAVGVRDVAGDWSDDWLDYAFAASVLAAPLWWGGRRWVLFALITMGVAWAQMLFTKNAGGGSHHIVLLWPLPHVVIAAALAGGADRLKRWATPAYAVALAVLCGANLLTGNQYLAQFVRNGPAVIWSDAVFPLSELLTGYEKRPVFLVEWGTETTLRMLHQGRIERLWSVDDSSLDKALLIPGSVFVSYTPSYDIVPGTTKHFLEGTARLGYRRNVLATVRDSNGRPIFELSEFAKPTATR